LSPPPLSPDKGLIFRITHRDNLAWLLQNGMHCATAGVQDPAFVAIGNPELIDRRRNHPVPLPGQGTLGDYVPFYFTPCSPMLLNIKTGWGGIQKRPNEEIIIIVSSLPRLRAVDVPFIFSDRHAYLVTARFSDDIQDLHKDPNRPEKVEYYQAEALVFRHVPTTAFLGVVCSCEQTAVIARATIARLGLTVKAFVLPQWYFQ
jgi:ssDNA thymidine ADP-ribosyltransferase, DarT